MVGNRSSALCDDPKVEDEVSGVEESRDTEIALRGSNHQRRGAELRSKRKEVGSCGRMVRSLRGLSLLQM